MKIVHLFALSLMLTVQSTPTPPPDLIAGSERTDSHGIAQVWVRAGTFIAGSTQEQADGAYQTCLANWAGMCLEHEYAAELFQHEVTLTYGYWIDQYEVTNAAYNGLRFNFCDTQCPNRWRDLSFDDGASRSAPVGSYPDGK